MSRSKQIALPLEKAEVRSHRKALPEIDSTSARNKVIQELIATEALYVDDLCVTIKVKKNQNKRLNTGLNVDTVDLHGLHKEV